MTRPSLVAQAPAPMARLLAISRICAGTNLIVLSIPRAPGIRIWKAWHPLQHLMAGIPNVLLYLPLRERARTDGA